MSQTGGAYSSFKTNLKAKQRSASPQALLALALLLLIFVSLVSQQLLRLPWSDSEQKDLLEWDFKPSLVIRRTLTRELKADKEAFSALHNYTESLMQSTETVFQPLPISIPVERLTEKSSKSDGIEAKKVTGTSDSTYREASLISDNDEKFRVKGLRKTANMAWESGRKAWRELDYVSDRTFFSPPTIKRKDVECPQSIIMEGQVLKDSGGYMNFPCGLTIGSSIAVVGVPHDPHNESKPTIGHIGDPGSRMTEVSQFMFELHGPKPSDDEEPSRILHVNPRLKGDWSEKPVIELNSFTKGIWGRSQRCDGSRSQYQERVEGLLNCERWLQEDGDEGAEASWWLRRLIERKEKPEMSWRYPFVQNRSFIMTIRAGLEGYHMSVDGKHVSSFGYQPGLADEITVASYVRGDVDVQALIATSLPSVHPKTVTEQIFENWQQWRAPKQRSQPISLFIGVLSSSNHFAERMAIRSTWFQDQKIQSGEVVARFFVALHSDREINIQMKKEADFYGDTVILPFMDDYDLVVLKTLAICEYGVRNVTTEYIMKCDDDTFIRVDAVLDELSNVKRQADSLYMGNMNMFHRPLRIGKWAVTFEEWPDAEYPTYANGPGYIISRKIASFIVTQNRRETLELFKMEDVSMGLWVKQYQESGQSVQYANIWKFFQSGCEDGYIIAHYQSPRHMLCLYKKVMKGELHCCN